MKKMLRRKIEKLMTIDYPLLDTSLSLSLDMFYR